MKDEIQFIITFSLFVLQYDLGYEKILPLKALQESETRYIIY